jgi:hypothetical protein
LSIKDDTAVALLEAQMDLKKKEAIVERSKALNVGRDLSNTNNKLGKLQADVLKSRKDYDDLACQVCNSELELTKVKKELTSTKKKILGQLDLTLAHKERIKDKELEKEQIKYDKTKESNSSKSATMPTNLLIPSITTIRPKRSISIDTLGRLQPRTRRPTLQLPGLPKKQ